MKLRKDAIHHATLALENEGESLYLDQGGALTMKQRDKLFTKAMALARKLEIKVYNLTIECLDHKEALRQAKRKK